MDGWKRGNKKVKERKNVLKREELEPKVLRINKSRRKWTTKWTNWNVKERTKKSTETKEMLHP